jgi:hypothetical protein
MEIVVKTLILPCGGKSSRFPNMKPKYILTHPDGDLMLRKAIIGMNLDQFDRIVITIVKEHDEKYEAGLILRQLFEMDKNTKYELLILDEFTSCQAETVAQTIELAGITGEIIVKDSDNYVSLGEKKLVSNCVAGINLETFKKDINRLGAKSFLMVNDQDIIIDIIEKKIKSQYICIGVYCFEDAEAFCKAYKTLSESNFNSNEIYISHVISYMIGRGTGVFKYIEADEYEDWGTLSDWEMVQKRFGTYLIDLDGVIFKNCGKYGTKNWSNSWDLIEENVRAIRSLSAQGAQIIIITSREEKYREYIKGLLENNGIKVFAMIMGCNHACRTIINDFAPTNPYPSCKAISIPRNGNIFAYLS